MRAQITILERLDEASIRKRVVAITADSVTVGSSEKSDIHLREISHPFLLEFKLAADGKWWILNAQKSGGLRVNGSFLSLEAPLKGNDEIEIHGHQVFFQTREGLSQSSFTFKPQPKTDAKLWDYLLTEKDFDEILINGPQKIVVDYRGTLMETPWTFSSDEFLKEKIHAATHKSSGWASWRMNRTLRIHAALPPLVESPHICIRKAKQNVMTLEELEQKEFGKPDEIDFLKLAIEAGENIVISGGTSTGKTVLLRSLIEKIPTKDRILLVEEEAETDWPHPHLVSVESGRGNLRQTVIEALRMRPTRLIISEVRGPEAFDMLQAMNTGHSGSMTTLHANSSREALLRLESLALSSGVPLTVGAIRKQIAQAIHIIVQLKRDEDGHRRIDHIVRVTGIQNETILLSDPVGQESGRIKQKLIHLDSRD